MYTRCYFSIFISQELPCTATANDVLKWYLINAQGTASLMLKNRKINGPWWSVSSFVSSQESWFQVFLLLKWLALTAFSLHFLLQGLSIFLIYGVCSAEVSLLGVSQGWQNEWEKWQVSYLDNWRTKLAPQMSVPLPFKLELTYMHPSSH